MLEARNIEVRVDDRIILRDLSCRLNEFEITAILGANGAGKTTLVRSFNNTVPISGGAIEIDGRPLAEMSRREIAAKMAVVSQENETKFPVTVLEYVLSGRFLFAGAFGWETKIDVAAAYSAIDDCDLEQFAGRRMNELSGGERQRVVLARALAAETPILLLDEPTANLDLAHQALMFRLVRERCRTRGVTAAVITHDLNIASEFADTIILLKSGKLFAAGSPATVLTPENIETVFAMKVLLDANPTSGKLRITSIF